jgi:beta-galactosidase GanA
MREADISLVRIGEFAWAKMEPAEGHYQWDWLDRAIDVLANEGLQIVLCTPTATPPAWLIQANPEILPVDSQDSVSISVPVVITAPTILVYRRYSARIVTELRSGMVLTLLLLDGRSIMNSAAMAPPAVTARYALPLFASGFKPGMVPWIP